MKEVFIASCISLVLLVAIIFFADPGYTSVQSEPAPAPACAVSPDRVLIRGLAEIIVDQHRDKVSLRRELESTRTEARRMILELMGEIDRIHAEQQPPDDCGKVAAR